MLKTLPRHALLALLRFYQAGVSPVLPPSCRFEPTCSDYARIAVERFGAARGSWLALKRLARCHPFGGRGWDPVPGGNDEAADAGATRDDSYRKR